MKTGAGHTTNTTHTMQQTKQGMTKNGLHSKQQEEAQTIPITP